MKGKLHLTNSIVMGLINLIPKYDNYMKPIIILFVCCSFLKADLIQPSNYAAIYHTHVLFEWEQIPSADRYQLMVALDEDFSDVVINVTDETLVYIDEENINWNTQHYWRVRKNNLNGDLGTWSDVYTFTTAEQKSNVNTTITDASQIAEGVTIFGSFFNYYSAVVDFNGNEIWNSGNGDLVFYNTNEDGDLFGCYLDNSSDNNLPGVEFDIANQLLWEEPNNEFLHHDLIQLPNGNYMGVVSVMEIGPIPMGSWTSLFQGLGYIADGVTLEFSWIGDKIVEWDKDTRDVVWSWNTFDYYNMQDYDDIGGTWDQAFIDQQYDWTHINAITFSEEDNAIYISTRHLSRITKIDHASGDVVWNMGHEFPSGDVDFGHDLGFSFQHSIQILDNGNIVTFDNGNLSEIFLGTDEPTSRAIEIDISNDGNSFNAEIEWEYVLPTDLFGFASGNAQKLENGNVLITTVGGGGTSLEVNTNGDIVWEADLNLSLPNGAVYRAMRIPGIYPVAFSILTQELHLHESEPSVYIGDSTVVFEIHNEGYNIVKYEYSLVDDEGWFDSELQETTIQAGESYTVTYSTDQLNDLAYANPMVFTVTPTEHTHLSKTVNVNAYTFPVAIDDELLPNAFKLYEPFPNPFNPSITIRFSVGTTDLLSLRVFDITGRLVETLVDDEINPGEYSFQWHAKNQPSGIYFVKLTSEQKSQTRKILLLK
ncbi:MAG: hypothetical protein CMG29_02490 [Candidatus Marinimicrobia bacterium]|nr:hypothetical protein [Candidatus Neomarinimicrobiota bacterium]